MKAGQDVPPQPNPTKEHLATHQARLEGEEFQTWPEPSKMMFSEHVRAEMAVIKEQLGQGEETEPDPVEEPQDPEMTGELPEEVPPIANPEEELPVPDNPEIRPGLVQSVMNRLMGRG